MLVKLCRNYHNISMTQRDFIEMLGLFDDWNEIFTNFIQLGDQLPVTCPDALRPHKINNCQSMTHFRTYKEGILLRVEGWSNAPVMRGIIVCMISIFDMTLLSDWKDETGIYFHIESGLINNLTPLRREGLTEMIRRILVLSNTVC